MEGKERGILVIGHGSRNAKSNGEFEQLVSQFQAKQPCLVRHAYIELAEPALSDALREMAKEVKQVILLPLFLFAAGHVKNDIPLALNSVRKEFLQTQFTVTPFLGVHPNMVELVWERMLSCSGYSLEQQKDTIVMVVGRGSSDPDANGDFCKLVRLFAEGGKFKQVFPAFMGITQPKYDETLEMLANARPDRLLVVPYLLFAGVLVERLEEKLVDFSHRFPWIKTKMTAHLGIGPPLLALMEERIKNTLLEKQVLLCDNCEYRAVLPERAEKVGGVKALLWSLRHTFTHNQAMPHTHAHKPLDKQVFICTNVDCAGRGSISLVEDLKRKLKDVGLSRKIRVTRTSCMGRCGEGPTVVVYPDGIWYRDVKAEDLDDLVQGHLREDKLVSRIVDNIMQ